MKTYKVVVTEAGIIRWYNEKEEYHCEHGPAVEYPNGNKYWYQNNKLHRLDGPAIEYVDGDKSWYQNGELHRLDGPAIECVNGAKYWYQNNKLHRLDGPAVECTDGSKYWFIEDKEYTEAEFKKKVKELKNPKSSCDGKVVTIEGKQYKLTEIK